jgi:hypothetical protein
VIDVRSATDEGLKRLDALCPLRASEHVDDAADHDQQETRVSPRIRPRRRRTAAMPITCATNTGISSTSRSRPNGTALQQPGDDPCPLPLSMREAHLERLLARRPDGIFVSPFEQGEIGPDLFRKACEFGLEGLVSKRKDRPYRGGRSKDWIKVKNRRHHAFNRVNDSFS